MNAQLTIHPNTVARIEGYAAREERFQYLTPELVEAFQEVQDENEDCDERDDMVVVTKYYQPDGWWTFYGCMFDEASGKMTGFLRRISEIQWGSWSVDDMDEVVGDKKMHLERAVDFTPTPFYLMSEMDRGQLQM